MVASRWMRDLYEAAGVWRRFGSYETYTGFEPRDRHTRIDFIWIGGPETTAEAAARAEEEGRTAWEVRRYEVLTNVVRDVHVSDHRAVVGNLLLLNLDS
ncbi:hypothetical protein VTK73DRAFT_5106 [Phialemonium thermophilum]|uniref:Uncharacterized protein n=1 Tax=Phialemonium thermophilum TaxID=223376 RepID=A0ABR3V4V0_9PEZI